jgi:hypothetical protein
MLGLLILATLLAGPAFDLSSQRVDVPRERSGSTGLVTVVVSDEGGAGVSGLTVEDFRVDDDGFPLESALLDRATTARATGDFRSEVVIVLGTMDVPERTRALSQAADLLKRLQAHKGARVEIIDGPLVVQSPTADLAAAARSLAAGTDPRNPRRGDQFALQAPVEAALGRLSDVPGSRKSLVYLVQNDLLGIDAFLAPRALDADVALYPVLVRRLEVGGALGDLRSQISAQSDSGEASEIAWDASSSNQAYQDLQFLDETARSTGGLAKLGGAKAVADLVAGSRGVYTLSCAITPSLADGGSHVISVSVRRPKVTVRSLGRYLTEIGH